MRALPATSRRLILAFELSWREVEQKLNRSCGIMEWRTQIMKIRQAFARSITASCLALVAVPDSAMADPPPWAPAHGYRAKHGRGHDEVVVYRTPYGIERGHCDRGIVSAEVVGGVVGGAVGAAAGSQIGKGKGQLAATAAGTIIGVLVGSAIGRAMDDVDQNCVGRILEHTPDRQRVVWANDGHDYAVVPLRTFEHAGAYCREYQTMANVGGHMQQVYGTACRQPDGAWKLMN